MSYDVHFLRPGQSFDDVDADEDGDDVALTVPQREEWERVVAAVLPLLPDAERFDGELSAELTTDDGLQLSLYGDELSLTVPYWHEGEQARRVADLMGQLVGAVEAATGRTGYDPQTEEPFDAGGTARVLDEVRGAVRDRFGPDRGEQVRVPWWRRLLRG